MKTVVVCVAVINLAWLVIFGIRDHFKRFENGEIETNLKIAARNTVGCCINIGLAIAVIFCIGVLHLHW